MPGTQPRAAAGRPAPQEAVAYINGTAYPIEKGESLLKFMRRHLGPEPVPTLCDAPNLEPYGSCRVCSVEVALKEDGPAKVMASCHTPVGEGMRITTHSPRMERLRRNLVEMVLTTCDTEKLKAEDHGRNELYNVVQRIGLDIDGVRYPKGAMPLDFIGQEASFAVDRSHPYMVSDLSSCIHCFRCVRACDEVQGEMVLTMAGRGFNSFIAKGTAESFMDSDCVSCGACAQACPTSAITDVFTSKENVADKVVRTVCTYCGVGCNLDVKVKDDKVISITAPYDAEVNQGHTCLKGRYAFSFYSHPDRLRTPLIKRNGKFEEATWDEAYAFIVDRLAAIRAEHGPESIAGISSARCPNEENYLMQKLMRAVVGTNSIDCCARVCHSPTAAGMQRTYGTGAATNSIDDLQHTDAMLLIGANPTDAHPVTGAKIKQEAMKGKTLIVIDPRRIHLARYATYHLQLRPGTNVALLNMMMHYIVKEDLVDKDFIASRTEGWEAFRKEVLAVDVAKMEEVTGVDRNLVREAAMAYAKANAAMSFHGLGVTEHAQGTFAVMQIADLAMMTGNIGRRGVGVNPLRGQNNVQGAADMGAQPHQGAGYLDLTDQEVQRLYEDHYGVPLPAKPGFMIPDMFNAALDGRLKALWLMGEDVVQSDPNTQKVIRALENLDLLIVQDIFMSESAPYADVILPAASFLEKNGTFTNGERRVQRVQAAVEPLEGTRPDGQIIVDVSELLAERLGLPNPFTNGAGAAPSIAQYQRRAEGNGTARIRTTYHPAWVLEEISAVVPFFKGIRWEMLGENGKQWPVAADGTDTKILHRESFKRGKGRFFAPHWEETPEVLEHGKDYPYIITTNRELEHYNAGTMTRRTANSEIITEDLLMINPEDAARNGIADGDMVCVESPRGKVDIKARVTDEVKPGILSSTFHFPEIMLNVITSDVHDSEAKCPEYKVVSCRIRKARKGHLRKTGEMVEKA